MRKITILLMLVATMLWAAGKPYVPASWWDNVSEWIEYEDAAKPDTTITNALSDSLGAYPDTTITNALNDSVFGGTIAPSQIGYSGSCVGIAYLDSIIGCSPVAFPSGISRYAGNMPIIDSLTVVYDTNYTSTDTATAETSDTVCMEGLYAYTATTSIIREDSGYPTCTLTTGSVEVFKCTNGLEGLEVTCEPSADDTFWTYARAGAEEPVYDSALAVYTIPDLNPVLTAVCETDTGWTALANDSCIVIRRHYQQFGIIPGDILEYWQLISVEKNTKFSPGE